MTQEAPDVVGTVFDEQSSRVAKVYAEALVNAASAGNDTEQVIAELEEIEGDILKPNPRFAEILSSPSVPEGDKDRILGEMLEGRALPTVVRFLKVLNRHGRLVLIGSVIHEARALWNRRQNRRPVLVKTVTHLDDDQKRSIQEHIATLIGATPILQFQIDTSLIGGLVIQDGDNLYDASLITRLQSLRRSLVTGRLN